MPGGGQCVSDISGNVISGQDRFDARAAFLAAFAYSMGFAPQVLGGAFLTALADRLAPRTVITAGLLLRAVPGLPAGSCLPPGSR